ncbi:type II 3-dehydroquinate dehydratase [Halobacillus sp. ACCC02827]|uniref:type II 3-dehydroquinate dehydratase n=1 Tax=Bacillaceae TaxID=186817 RepID=UPI0002A4DE31|nr:MULTISPECIES: type II 3-dehydroquinate dehydratase [Bacillaceae]ELK46249.1 3-dehydroquinate dehydratase [Halobacillus sp. BAB-2008]QHT47134.1 type II 3-dehydroquinate dehydratase [Bacillus sp. SB49]WJE14361.1 type II 3-dehydroquinate dehydratase [Halobacillus sp. ACCC02827]
MGNKRIFLINGPNLNMLGKREPDTYGHDTLEDVVQLVKDTAWEAGYEVEDFQSNHEGELVDRIQLAEEKAAGIIINPAAYTHTSIALRDAISAITPPVIEIHISNVHSRETFRHTSMLAPVCAGQIVGFGIDGYRLAVMGIIDKIEKEGRN